MELIYDVQVQLPRGEGWYTLAKVEGLARAEACARAMERVDAARHGSYRVFDQVSGKRAA